MELKNSRDENGHLEKMLDRKTTARDMKLPLSSKAATKKAAADEKTFCKRSRSEATSSEHRLADTVGRSDGATGPRSVVCVRLKRND